ncbi:MAG: hypothetical protein OXH01_11305 [Bacteroidetes bacterium]|nr:hypothetical protein [Bacteroidota bacterium]
MTKRFSFLSLALLTLLTLTPLLTHAQSVSFGADFFNRYIWRGYDFGDSFSVQPGLALSAGNFELGTWGSYSISSDGADANEHDLYATYSIGLGASASLDLTVTDYYFPNSDAEAGEWLNFDGDGEGAHWIELMGAVTLPESFPLTITAAFMAHNDPDNSLYLEGAIPFTVADVELGFTLGLVAGESGFYGVEGASVVNLGLSASKDLQITDNFALPLSAAYVMNPTTEKTYLVFGFSLSP